MEIRYKLTCYNNKEIEIHQCNISRVFPTKQICKYSKFDTYSFLIIYVYVKDIHNNYIVVKRIRIDKTLMYYINKFNINLNLKQWLNKVLKPDSLYSNLRNLKVGDFLLKSQISKKRIDNTKDVITNFELELYDFIEGTSTISPTNKEILTLKIETN